jgi:hypothetical protein
MLFGREDLWLARGTGNRTQKIEVSRHPLGKGFFEGTPSPREEDQLVSLLKKVLRDAVSSFAWVQVALPDPATRWELFELAEVPVGGREKFLEWKFNRSSEGAYGPLSCVLQEAGRRGGKTRLIGVAADGRWMALLKNSFRRAGIGVSVIDAGLGFRFNRCLDSMGPVDAGALLTLEPEFWSLGIWDQEGLLRYARSRWWTPGKGAGARQRIASVMKEVERTVHAYVYSGEGRSIGSLFLMTTPPLRKEAGRQLSAKLKDGWKEVPLPVPAAKGPSSLTTDLSPSALAALVRR